eukprot:2033245-Pyramimonas_sp.AAC.2
MDTQYPQTFSGSRVELFSGGVDSLVVDGGVNSLVVERLNKGLMDNPQLGHFFGLRKDLASRTELSSGGVA